jgi:hypothetical protein
MANEKLFAGGKGMFPKRRSDVTVREVDGELLVLDHRTERVHQLNATAVYIWNQCDGATSVADISKAIATEYGLDTHPAEADVVRTVAQFRALDLLEGAEESV